MSKLDELKKKFLGKTLNQYCVYCRKKHMAKIDDVVVRGPTIFANSPCPETNKIMWRILGRK